MGWGMASSAAKRVFDETFLHHVRNDTDHSRLILMCDVRRPLNFPGRVLNACVQFALRLSVVPNTSKDRRGLVNRIFHSLAPLLSKVKGLKQTHRPVYLAIKWTVNLSLVALGLGFLTLLAWWALRLIA